MPGINTCLLILEQAQSFTGWHAENMRLPSINYSHSGELPAFRFLSCPPPNFGKNPNRVPRNMDRGFLKKNRCSNFFVGYCILRYTWRSMTILLKKLQEPKLKDYYKMLDFLSIQKYLRKFLHVCRLCWETRILYCVARLLIWNTRNNMNNTFVTA